MKPNPLTIAAAFICTVTCVPMALASAKEVAKGKPLKVYILAGQSNMQGKAQPSTVPRMALSPESKHLHDKMLNGQGEPITHENVSIVYFTGGDEKKGEKRPLLVEKGKLAVGTTGAIGPELGFGITMDEAVDQPILIIKTAWGGKSLNYNFRPPSAGLRPYEFKPSRKQKTPPPAEELKKLNDEFTEPQGDYYRLMMKLIQQVLADPAQYSDAYDPKLGYEIAGFAWFQGYNDQFYYPGSYDHYTKNMAHLIRDVRKELKAPEMPFVIGVIGIGGDKGISPKQMELRKAMAATAEIPEFKGTVAAVETGPFWDHEVQSAVDKLADAQALWGNSEGWEVVGKPSPKDRIWTYTSFTVDEEKHYTEPDKKVMGADRRFNVLIPTELKDWLNPDFDTSAWQKGPAPIGKAAWGEPSNDKQKAQEELFRSPWGEGNLLLAKTSFDLSADDISDFRLCYHSTSSFMIYVNGQRVINYPWWKDAGIRKDELDAKQLNKGVNHLAFYGNILDKQQFNAVDVYLEGLPRDKAAALRKQQNEIATPRDHALAKGKSNQAYHYLGSAYTYTLIGEALAKAMQGLD